MKAAVAVARPDLHSWRRRPILQLLSQLSALTAGASFAAFLVLALSTPAWRVGPFAWWPLVSLPVPAHRPAVLGALSLLPLLSLLGWAGANRRPWRWGSATVTAPLVGLSLLVLSGLEPAPTERTVVQLGGLALLWYAYLYQLNGPSPVRGAFLVVVAVQGGVALVQFALQQDLGLSFLGEPALDPQVEGTSVLWDSDQRAWLRGYGLTAHPNVLGAMLSVMLLTLLPGCGRLEGWARRAHLLGLAVGTLGLLVSCSRASYLALAAGLVAHRALPRAGRSPVPRVWGLWVPLVLALTLLVAYGDPLLSRWTRLDTLIEARSLQERGRDARVALELISARPWLGVGVGNGLAAARALHPEAGPVHCVPLLVMVETGLLGGAGWLALMALPLLGSMRARQGRYAHVWVALLVAGTFDTPLWFWTNWRGALLMGLLAALQAQGPSPQEGDQASASWV